jgi:hypothetical protein
LLAKVERFQGSALRLGTPILTLEPLHLGFKLFDALLLLPLLN